MKQPAPSLFKRLRDPRALVFGLAVFNLFRLCAREPEWDNYKFAFASVTLLAASMLTLVPRVWSSFAAAVTAGYMPMQFAYEFWMVPRSAEVPPFSLRHLAIFAGGVVEAPAPVILFLALSVLILACSARTLKRLTSS